MYVKNQLLQILNRMKKLKNSQNLIIKFISILFQQEDKTFFSELEKKKIRKSVLKKIPLR